MKFSFVIPAYNEERRIGSTLQAIQNYVQNNPDDYELIIVDNASTDNTAQLVLSVFPTAKVLHEPRRGKGAALQKGILQAQGTYILFLDADHSARIEELDKLLPFVQAYDVVIGSRDIPGAHIGRHQNFLKESFGKIGNFFIRSLLGLPFYDTQCGFKLFKKNLQPLVKKLHITGWGFDIELLYAALQNGYTIKEVGIEWRNDTESKVQFTDYFQTLKELFRIKKYWKKI